MHIGTNLKKINITKEKETKLISERFSEIISKGDIICLYGNLGVGKTTFVKYLINNIQRKNKVKETEIASPTFSIVNEGESFQYYETLETPGITNFTHIQRTTQVENITDTTSTFSQ